MTNGIDPSLREHPAVGVPAFREVHSIADPSPWHDRIEWGRNDIIIAAEHGWPAGFKQRLTVADEPFKPAELIIEFGARRWIAIGQVETANHKPVYIGLDVAAVRIVSIARQTAPTFYGIYSAGKDCNAVVRPLTVPDRAVSGIADSIQRKLFVRGFEFLKANDVVLGFTQPPEKHWQAAVDAVYIESCNADHEDLLLRDCVAARQLSGSRLSATASFSSRGRTVIVKTKADSKRQTPLVRIIGHSGFMMPKDNHKANQNRDSIHRYGDSHLTRSGLQSGLPAAPLNIIAKWTPSFRCNSCRECGFPVIFRSVQQRETRWFFHLQQVSP
jgi:hypothetical protein